MNAARIGIAVLALCAATVARAGNVYLELDGHWYNLPLTSQYATEPFSFADASGYPTVYLSTAQFTLCAPTSGSNSFGTPFLFYGPTSYPVYQWSSVTWSALPGSSTDFVVTVKTVNGTMLCTDEIPAPYVDKIFANGFD